MPRRRLRAQLYPSFLVVTVAALVAATWFATTAFRSFYRRQVVDALSVRARFAASQLAGPLKEGHFQEVQRLVHELDALADTRITVILPGGEVIADSRENPADMENQSGQPEFVQARTGEVGVDTRFSRALGRYMIFVAIGLEPEPAPAVVRAALPSTEVTHALRQVYVRLILAGFVIALVAAGLSWLLARRLTRPLEHIRNATRRFAAGDFSGRIRPPAVQELAELAEAANSMASLLDDRIRALTRQRNEHQAILASMSEGVIAIDADGHVMSLNQAAADILRMDAQSAQGRTVEELFRNRELQEFVRQSLESTIPQETDVVLSDAGPDRYVRVHSAILHPQPPLASGAVLVLHDVTQLRRLEDIRRGFVANASHELKTPVTTIKGFVETLLGGAIDEPEQARRFLAIIARQSDRLAAIIDDILDLTRIEEQHEHGRIGREMRPLRPLLAEAIDLCQVPATEKDIPIHLECPVDLAAPVNGPLLEQALVNLILNAVKYSPEKTPVRVTAEAHGHAVHVAVVDQGPGIEAQHLDRIFERFYVVDTARSRKLGGTGLGLAIVKHIAHAHGGSVSVQSRPGEGSTFTLALPAAAE